MKRFLILLSILGSSSFLDSPLAHANTSGLDAHQVPADVRNELYLIHTAIERYTGSKVYWDDEHELCRLGLLGAYMPHLQTMVNCVSNHNGDYAELIMTAKHEGWHAVQHICNDYRAALKDDQIRPHLMEPVQDTLRHSYHPKQHRAEAEARVVEQIPTPNWINGIRAYCGHIHRSSSNNP